MSPSKNQTIEDTLARPNATEVTTKSLATLRTVDTMTIELACVDLICQLESQLESLRSLKRSEQVAIAAEVANKMLVKLLDFSEQCLRGTGAEAAQKEIIKASDASLIHQEILKGRSYSSAWKSFFNSDRIDDNAKESFHKLGKAMARACSTTFYHAVESTAGQKIAQSTLVFVQELEQSW